MVPGFRLRVLCFKAYLEGRGDLLDKVLMRMTWARKQFVGCTSTLTKQSRPDPQSKTSIGCIESYTVGFRVGALGVGHRSRLFSL